MESNPSANKMSLNDNRLANTTFSNCHTEYHHCSCLLKSVMNQENHSPQSPDNNWACIVCREEFIITLTGDRIVLLDPINAQVLLWAPWPTGRLTNGFNVQSKPYVGLSFALPSVKW